LFKTDEGKIGLLLLDFDLTMMTIDIDEESNLELKEIMKISDLLP